MSMMIGITAGESRRACAGATYAPVALAVSEDGAVATLGDRKVAIASDTLVIWHQSDAGTWHGVYDPVTLRTRKATEAHHLLSAAQAERLGGSATTDYRGMLRESESGGASIAAAILKVDRPLAIVTSGYKGRRAWRLLVVEPDGAGGIAVTYEGDPPSYRALYAPVETL